LIVINLVLLFWSAFSFAEADDANQSKAEQKSRVYYRSCLDKNDTIEKLGSKPLEQFLAQVSFFFDPHKCLIIE